MQTVDREADNQHNYDRLMVALEASQGKLDLLIAVCDDRNLQESLIRQYEAELAEQGIAHYRVAVRQQSPSLRQALGHLVQDKPALQRQEPAVVTVQGIDTLLSARLGKEKSEQEQLFGYLQWTREALRDFHFPVVIWVNQALLAQVAEQAPDFWSWRGGVFWFAGKMGFPQLHDQPVASQKGIVPVGTTQPQITDLLHLIEQIEQQAGREAPPLARLYEQLGEIYAQRRSSGSDRQFAIQAYKRAIQLQRTLGLRAELAESLEHLGNLYFELKNNVELAFEAYSEALGLYRQVGARLGEANTLQAIGDLLQFLDRRTEALANYEQALGLYREVGARLGEANVLQELGKLQNEPETGLESLNQAQVIYQQIGDQYSQSRNLLFIADRHLQLRNPEAAIQTLQQAAALAVAIDYEPFQEYATAKIAELQQPLTSE